MGKVDGAEDDIVGDQTGVSYFNQVVWERTIC